MAITSRNGADMCKRVCRYMAVIATCLGVAGCGPSTRIIEGKVTLDGKPLTSGAIEFEPTDNSERLLGADIMDGSYHINVPQDQTQGEYIVRIISPQSTGRKVAAGSPAPPGTMIDGIADVVPAQYNTKTILKVDLSIAGPHNFELFSRPHPTVVVR